MGSIIFAFVLMLCMAVLFIYTTAQQIRRSYGLNKPKPNELYNAVLWQLPKRFKVVEVVNHVSAYVQDSKTGLYFFVHLSSNSYDSFLSYTHVPEERFMSSATSVSK